MRLLAHRARHELRATGARPRRTALSGIDALTPAEHRVAALAADGHSNREIAQQLYVTRRTVETHLTHVFQKLDITSRADLAARLTDQPRPTPPHRSPHTRPRRPIQGKPQPRPCCPCPNQHLAESRPGGTAQGSSTTSRLPPRPSRRRATHSLPRCSSNATGDSASTAKCRVVESEHSRSGV